MIYLILTLIFISIIAWFSYKLSNNSINSPTFLSASAFFLVIVFDILNYNRWGVEYSFYPCFILVSSILSMLLGESFACVTKIKHEYRFGRMDFCISENFNGSYFFCAISILSVIFTWINTVNAAVYAGYSSRTGMLLQYARWGIHSDGYSLKSISTYLYYFAVGIGYLSLFVFVDRILNKRNIGYKSIKLIIPIVCHILIVVLSTSRADIIQYVYITLVFILICYEISHKWKPLPVFKAFGIGLVGIILLYIAFLVLGAFTGKVVFGNIWNTVSIYTGSSFPAFNIWLKNATINYNFQETFWGLIQFLNRLGFNIESTSLVKEFVQLSTGSETNIYTALRHYYQDFGFFGVVIIYFLKGFVFTKMYKGIRKRNKYDLGVLLYAYFSYDVIRQITAADFLSAYFSIYHMFTVIFIVIAYLLVRKPKNSNDNRIKFSYNNSNNNT